MAGPSGSNRPHVALLTSLNDLGRGCLLIFPTGGGG
jgi:hypothetical protein